MKRGKFQPELPGGYLMLYHRILDSNIFNSLPPPSQIIYIKALSKANRAVKHGNCFILTPNNFKNSSIKTRTFRRHIKLLISKGFIVLEEPGGLFRNANKYSIAPIRNIFLNNAGKHWNKDTV